MAGQRIRNTLPILPQGGPASDLQKRVETAPSFLIANNVRPQAQDAPGHYVVGQNYHVPVAEIRENKNNARVFYTEIEIDETGKSIVKNGQSVPAVGYVEDGFIYLTDGQKRWKSVRDYGVPTLWVTITEKPPSTKEAYLTSRRINSERSEQTPFDDAVRWHQLLEDKVFANQTELAEAVGLDQSTVSRTIGINLIPTSIRTNMRNTPGHSDLRIACAISSIFKCQQIPAGQGPELEPGVEISAEKAQEVLVEWRISTAEQILADAKRSGLSVRKVESLVDSKLAAAKRKPRSQIQTFKYAGKSVTVKVLEASGKLDLAVKGLEPEALTALHQKIQDLLVEKPT